MFFLALFAGTYILASVNVAIVVMRLAQKNDPREVASENPGTSNVYRIAGPFWAGIVLILDIGRALGVALLGYHLLPLKFVPLVGIALVLGNRFPLFHGFKGGKGVANYLGFTIGLTPISACVSALVWVLVFWFSGHAFVSSFAMVGVLAIGTLWKCGLNIFTVLGVLGTVAIIVWAHQKNLTTFDENSH